MTAKFDTLRFAIELEKAGATRELAQRLATLLYDDVLSGMATLQDLKALEQSLKIWFGSTLAMAVGIIVAAQRLL
jgi:hypothetical protein